MSNSKNSPKRQWRSLDQLNAAPDAIEQLHHEFPEGTTEREPTGIERRQFMQIMGASAAMTGVGLTGCLRKSSENILPFAERPEDRIPGVPERYATGLWSACTVVPALVTSYDGRPTKVDGNPRDARTGGSTSPFAQAEILNIYDRSRSNQPWHDGNAARWADAYEAMEQARTALRANGGAGTALVVDGRPSPTLARQVRELQQALPQLQVFVGDPIVRGNRFAGLRAACGDGATISYNLSRAKVIVSLDCDFAGTEPDAIANARGFAAGRRVQTPTDEMNRLYVVEPSFSATGSTADHHLHIPASEVGSVLKALAQQVFSGGVSDQVGVGAALAGASAPAGSGELIAAMASDLAANVGSAVVMVGERQPAWVHALALALNQSLNAVGGAGAVVQLREEPTYIEAGGLADLQDALASGITTLIIAGANPAYDASGTGMAEAIAAVENSFHLGYYRDETAEVSKWHIPQCHQLEAWGDLLSADGTGVIQQPLIAPLYISKSDIEFLHQITGDGSEADAMSIVQATWLSADRQHDPAGTWRTWLRDGLIPAARPSAKSVQAAGILEAANFASNPAGGDYELNFQLDTKIFDGRYVNNPWLQELPDFVTKLTWDNAALVSPATADELGLRYGSGAKYGREKVNFVRLSANGAEVEIPAFVVPAVADKTIVLPIGYGRSIGIVAEGAGRNVNPIRSANSPWIARATVQNAGGRYKLATTQDHGSLVPGDVEYYARPLVREATLEEFRHHPDFVRDDDLMQAGKINSLWTEPNARHGQQWGMTIDLSTCVGCNACVVACQAENNISVVGKQRVLEGREMHWIRIDRYFTGDPESPEVVSQPVGCMHCENAPCEQVCPVAATVHSPEGLNDMVYNRCIGTRYCANNCPYKVRRYNFFAFAKEDYQDNRLITLARNPNVTVRHRGVMEKCSYCVQRISAAKLEAKKHGTGIIPDGQIVVACQQACPTDAIVFGDVNNPNSAVSQSKGRDTNYGLLEWLNTKPRTTYLAKIRNPNPELV